jgi:hypothetical protein
MVSLRAMKTFLSFLAGGAVVAAVLGAYVLKVPLALVATLGVGLACLAWLVVIVVLPWNLYFQARHVLFEMEGSKARGLAVSAEHEASTRAVKARMLRVSVGLHLASAALLAAGSTWSGEPLGQIFAALFLLSTLFRPAVEYYRYLRVQLAQVMEQVKYPREDVVTLRTDVEQHTAQLRQVTDSHAELERELAQLKEQSLARTADAHRRLDSVARKFDEALDRLTDNREVIAGLKAFLRLVREPATSGQ